MHDQSTSSQTSIADRAMATAHALAAVASIAIVQAFEQMSCRVEVAIGEPHGA
jgi:hypothetical protein